ncbi:hypothetical protein HP15_p187g129 (plasmid) [Marinobacter adhaerens HP15]|uniref:Uncharacterized protein n=1 Tax=Marinobacter adhaerens (strain DSM 23420 / HP15) TaxID=225937 RepID=E4PS91_MARAH|nr:hypothetical protein HP15_p187g129 [Marinobacter adhaerens HP15]
MNGILSDAAFINKARRIIWAGCPALSLQTEKEMSL